MIRRRRNDDSWVIIRQIDHANLSHQLAKHWGNDSFAPIINDETLDAILHHDDGWQCWDDQLHFRENQTEPIAFNEMSWIDTQPIWEASIAAARQLGPLAAYITTMHFLALSESGGNWSDDESAFHRRYSANALLWKRQSLIDSPEINSEAEVNRALQQLRFFDFLSIWICVAKRDEPSTFSSPNSIDVEATPVEWDGDAEGQTFHVAPWPWDIETFDVRIPAYLLTPSTTSRSLDALAPIELCWRLQRENRQRENRLD